MIGIEIKPGSKGEGDQLVTVNGYALSFLEILEIILILMSNEDKLYPPKQGFMGACKLSDFYMKYIKERRMPIDQELKDLKLGKFKPEG